MPREIVAFLSQVEEKLGRMLASGWRNAGPDAAGFARDAEALAAVGLHDVAARLRDVASATGPIEGLRAVTLASAACRLARAHLVDTPPPDAHAKPLLPRRPRAADRLSLVPLGRMTVEGDVVWSCLQSRGYAWEWLLLDPPEWNESSGPWLACGVEGFPVWSGRYPFGAIAEVTRVALHDVEWIELDPETADLPALGDLHSGKMRSTQIPLWGGGYLTLAPLDAETLDRLNWLDERVAADLIATPSQLWGLVWDQQRDRILTAAFLRGDGWCRVVHLTPGCPDEELPAGRQQVALSRAG